ncbi:MAG: DUF4271 domain-containing protein [Chitinophagaceae bacterium]
MAPVIRLTYLQMIRTNPMMNFQGKPRYEMARNETIGNKDGLFYLMTGFVLMFALIRLIFWKYMDNLFNVLFRISLKQKQMREQLIQSPLPSLLLNLFFAIAGGIYISFLLTYYQVDTPFEPWQFMILCIVGLAALYLAKFLLLKLMGWIFNIGEATDTYIFIVFMVNKLLGIILIPVLIIIAFSGEPFVSIVIILSLLVIAVFFLYRYIASYEPVRREIKVSQIHFVIYLLAFELSPLLLIYKVLLTYIGKST